MRINRLRFLASLVVVMGCLTVAQSVKAQDEEGPVYDPSKDAVFEPVKKLFFIGVGPVVGGIYNMHSGQFRTVAAEESFLCDPFNGGKGIGGELGGRVIYEFSRKVSGSFTALLALGGGTFKTPATTEPTKDGDFVKYNQFVYNQPTLQFNLDGRYKIGRTPLFAMGGMAIGYALSNKYTHTQQGDGGSVEIKPENVTIAKDASLSDVNKLQFGPYVGAGYNYKLSKTAYITADLRYVYGLSKVRSVYDWKWNHVNLDIAYIFIISS